MLTTEPDFIHIIWSPRVIKELTCCYGVFIVCGLRSPAHSLNHAPFESPPLSLLAMPNVSHSFTRSVLERVA